MAGWHTKTIGVLRGIGRSLPGPSRFDMPSERIPGLNNERR